MDVSVERESLCVRGVKTAIRYLISHVGLICLIVAYSLLGAVVYQNLEETPEKAAREKVGDLRTLHLWQIWIVTRKLGIPFDRDKWEIEADKELKKFQEEIYLAVKLDGWDGKDVDDESLWSFARALLFSVTVITTIGYGDVTPKSILGRVFTILYALIGIPLLMICLANTGKLLAGSFRLLYGSILDSSCTSCKNCSCQRKSSCCQENSSNRNAIYQAEGQRIPYIRNEAESEVELEEMVQPYIKSVNRHEKKKVHVSFWICLLIILLYMSLGATWFSCWERWGYFESFYFCFVTLSTIGFGDYVPGTGHSWGSHAHRVICALYLLFGLTLLAMCFDLVQEKIRKQCRAIGINIHLLPNDS